MEPSCGVTETTSGNPLLMKRKPLPLLAGSLILLSLALPACQISKQQSDSDASQDKDHQAIVTEKLEPYQCGTITRLHTVGGVFLASQPKPEDFAQAKKGGVKTVINLRHLKEIKDFNEQEVVEGLGLNYEPLAWNGPGELTDEVFDRTRKLLKSADRPLLLHCGSANRVGAVWLPYRVLDEGVALDDAVAEANTVGLKSAEYERLARDYIARKK